MGEVVRVEIDVSDLQAGQTQVVEHQGLSVLICNVDGTLYAVENLCSHAQVPLDEGELRGCEIECLFHGATFDVRTGEPHTTCKFSVTFGYRGEIFSPAARPRN